MTQLEVKDGKEGSMGRGLIQMFGGPVPKEEFQRVDIDLVRPAKYQPRQEFDPLGIQELAESIKTQGILQPILVRPVDEMGAQFEIVAGERRYQAARQAGLKVIPIWIRKINDQQALEIGIIENVQRQDLNLIEEGQAYKKLLEMHQYTHDDVARVVKKSRSYVTNTLRLLTLPEKVQEALRKNLITASHARTLINMENATELIDKITEGQMNVRQTEALKKEKNPKENNKVTLEDVGREAVLTELAYRLSQQLMMTVTIDFAFGLGEMKIKFKGLEKLDHLMKLLGSKS